MPGLGMESDREVSRVREPMDDAKEPPSRQYSGDSTMPQIKAMLAMGMAPEMVPEGEPSVS